ncbi:heparinase II/III domain-containing protein [Flavitalea antarctica]
MRKQLLLIAVMFTACVLSLSAQSKNLLSGKYNVAALKKVLIPVSSWKPFPKADDREAWSKADQKMLQGFLRQADSLKDYQWPYIPATKSLLIERTGDRNEYQSVSFEKRNVLGTLLMAEIYENKGRFTDAIINGVWSICEESWWGVPAHLPRGKEYSGLVDVTAPFVDLFAAETGTFLAWVDYYMGEKLDAVSPQIRKRIYVETNRRLFEPLMNKPHGWMTKNANGRPPNNWNPWICSNWLNTALLVEKNEDKRVAMVEKILKVLDEFVNPYPMDGGCDEGPGYWGAAAASLYDNISLLNLASNNAFKYIYDDEKIKNMGRFIYRAQIGEDYFLNFADADPQPTMAASMIYRFGKDIGDHDMMAFGAFYRKDEDNKLGRFHYFRNFYSLFLQDEFQKAEQRLPLPGEVWLPDIQVMLARDRQGSVDGFFVAAKGGHNDESHNHNDIGNYVVYYNGLPLLIDVGRGTYTRKTFSDKRYEIWYNCSDYHNVPTINGFTQPPGSRFRAGNVKYKNNKDAAVISMDIAASYPAEAGVRSWQRAVTLNRQRNVTVIDDLVLDKAEKITQHLMTCYPAEVTKAGEVIIHFKDRDGKAKDFKVAFDQSKMRAQVEKIPLTAMEDKGIIEKWGDNIYRINFDVIKPKAKDNMKFIIAAN